jgi:hypothetical protein
VFNVQGIEKNIGVLVNNVGIGYEHPEYFLQIDNCAQRSRFPHFSLLKGRGSAKNYPFDRLGLW